MLLLRHFLFGNEIERVKCKLKQQNIQQCFYFVVFVVNIEQGIKKLKTVKLHFK